MTGPELLVLWDIDGPLIAGRGFGGLMYQEAFRSAFGRELTPHDVYAVTKAGVRVVAVATGRSSTQDLRGAGAEAVLGSLADLGELTRQVWGRAARGNRET